MTGEGKKKEDCRNNNNKNRKQHHIQSWCSKPGLILKKKDKFSSFFLHNTGFGQWHTDMINQQWSVLWLWQYTHIHTHIHTHTRTYTHTHTSNRCQGDRQSRQEHKNSFHKTPARGYSNQHSRRISSKEASTYIWKQVKIKPKVQHKLLFFKAVKKSKGELWT